MFHFFLNMCRSQWRQSETVRLFCRSLSSISAQEEYEFSSSWCWKSWLPHRLLFSCSYSCHPHLLTSPPLPPPSPTSTSSSSSSSCLDNITAYYFSYFHPSLCPYRPVSQAVMCDLELSLRLRVSSVGVRWLVYWDVTGGVTPNKPTSPPSPFLTPPLCDRETPPWSDGWVAGCSRQVGCG